MPNQFSIDTFQTARLPAPGKSDAAGKGFAYARVASQA